MRGWDHYRRPATALGEETEESPYPVTGGGRRSRAWRVSGLGPNASLSYAVVELRNKSRDQVRKNPYAAGASDQLVSNIIGTGIKPRSLVKDKELRQQIHDLWNDWTDQADANGAFDFYGLQALAVRGMVEGGETFTRMRPRRLTDGLAVPLQLQVMEADHCPHTKNVEVNGGGVIRQGIEYNGIGRRTAFHLYRSHPGEYNLPGQGLSTVAVPAGEIAHLFRATRPGQARGEPWLTRALRTLYDLDQYLDAELVRKKVSAMLVAFVKKTPDNDNIDAAPLGAGDPDDTGTSDISFEPGTIQVLAEGEDVTFSDPKDVGANFEPFVRQQLRGVSVAAGILYEMLSGDYGTLNDRTLRAAINNFRRQVEMWQHTLVAFQFNAPIWSFWIDMAVMSGALQLKGNISVRDLKRVRWIPQGWPYIHPVQDIEAQEKKILAGLSSREEQVSLQGDDVEDVDDANERDLKRAKRKGLRYTSDPIGQQANASAPQNGGEPAVEIEDDEESED